MNTTGIRIKEALKIRNMKQSELAKKTGISKSMISEYLHDKYEPKQNNVFLIAKALDVSANYLLGLSDSDDAKYTIDGYDALNEDGKELVFNYIAMLSNNEKYCKVRKDK